MDWSNVLSSFDTSSPLTAGNEEERDGMDIDETSWDNDPNDGCSLNNDELTWALFYKNRTDIAYYVIVNVHWLGAIGNNTKQLL